MTEVLEPVFEYADEIIRTVRDNKVTIINGPTGSGKTTKIPIFLHCSGLFSHKMIGVTEPRRIAATSVAEYVAGELEEELGQSIGYKVRYNNETGPDTRIKFMTDGILLREMQSDPELSKYSVIMVDEAHERGRNIDFILGLLKELLVRRDDLRVVIASATIDSDKFSKHFWNAPVINIPGRMYPVEIIWSEKDYWDSRGQNRDIAKKVIEICNCEPEGDILVFVAGVDDISSVMKLIEEERLRNVVVLPAHSSLDPDRQKMIFERYRGVRKIVVATNIAETSITIDGVVYVVDSGMVKQVQFDPRNGFQSLVPVNHSKAGCDQRTGRAGRTCPGKCFRLYTKESFRFREDFTEPEIRRMSAAGLVLIMEDMGIKNIRNFDFVDKLEPVAFKEAYETLRTLGALCGRELTATGRLMAALPLEPKISRMLIEADKFDCSSEVATIAAFLSVRNVLCRPEGKEEEADRAHAEFKERSSDIFTFLNIWREYALSGFSFEWCRGKFLNAKALHEVKRAREQIIEILIDHNFKVNDGTKALDRDKVMRAVVSGLAYDLYRKSGFIGHSYRPLLRENGSDVYIHPGSSVFGADPQFMVSAKILETGKPYAHVVTTVKTKWLQDLLPDSFRSSFGRIASVDANAGIARVAVNTSFNGVHVGSDMVEISLAEAGRIQRDQVAEAKKNGWVRLVFRKENRFSLFGSKLVSTHEGKRVETYYVTEGKRYWCLLGGSYREEMMVLDHFEEFENLNEKPIPKDERVPSRETSSVNKPTAPAKEEEATEAEISKLLSLYGPKKTRR